jgi:hypothetical protein
MARRWEDPKDPDELLDYQVDWTQPLAGDLISTSTWIVPDGIEAGQEANTTTTATIWLSGGEVGKDYSLINRITTAAGRIRDQTCVLKCRVK